MRAMGISATAARNEARWFSFHPKIIARMRALPTEALQPKKVSLMFMPIAASANNTSTLRHVAEPARVATKISQHRMPHHTPSAAPHVCEHVSICHKEVIVLGDRKIQIRMSGVAIGELGNTRRTSAETAAATKARPQSCSGTTGQHAKVCSLQKYATIFSSGRKLFVCSQLH